MADQSDTVTFTLPRSAVKDVLQLSSGFGDRMHGLLERDTEKALNATERSELELLVRVAHLDEVLSMSMRARG